MAESTVVLPEPVISARATADGALVALYTEVGDLLQVQQQGHTCRWELAAIPGSGVQDEALLHEGVR